MWPSPLILLLTKNYYLKMLHSSTMGYLIHEHWSLASGDRLWLCCRSCSWNYSKTKWLIFRNAFIKRQSYWKLENVLWTSLFLSQIIYRYYFPIFILYLNSSKPRSYLQKHSLTSLEDRFQTDFVKIVLLPMKYIFLSCHGDGDKSIRIVLNLLLLFN